MPHLSAIKVNLFLHDILANNTGFFWHRKVKTVHHFLAVILGEIESRQ